VESEAEVLEERIRFYIQEITTLTYPPKFELENWEEDFVEFKKAG